MKTGQLKIVIIALAVAAIGWIGWGAFQFTMDWKKNFSKVPTPKSIKDRLAKEFGDKNKGSGLKRKNLRDYRVLSDFNITGAVATPVNPTTSKEPAPAPVDPLTSVLKIRYTQVNHEEPAKSLAGVEYTNASVASAAGEKTATLHAEDHLPGSYSRVYVAEIHNDRVVFKYDNEDKETVLDVGKFDPEGVMNISNGAGPSSSGKSQGYPSHYKRPDKTMMDPQNPDVVWVGIEDQKEFETNYQTILRDVSISRNYNRKTGKPEGFRINRVGKSAQNYASGVQAGDVIKSVNGVPVNSKEEAINYVKQHPDLDTYTVVIERRGREITRTYKPPKK